LIENISLPLPNPSTDVAIADAARQLAIGKCGLCRHNDSTKHSASGADQCYEQDTRPSTPPPYAVATFNSSLSSHPYLQQLEEAISTPVPDLASTLTTPEHRLIHSTTSEAWDGRPVLHLSNDDEIGQRIRRDALERAGSSSEVMDRMQQELDRWQTERNRLRSILHNQQSRQSMLEEQNYRLREQRSRLQEEHTRLHEQTHRVNDRNSSLRDDLHTLREAQSNLSNLAGAIAEAGRDSYATTGSGPSRQRLYDWAAPRHHQSHQSLHRPEDDDGDNLHAASASGDVNSVPRRELERALRDYRVARSAFRSGRQPGSDLGAVPTASALRAYWNEEPGDSTASYRAEDTSTSRTPFALSDFVEQHRVERQRRHLEVIRRQNEQRRNDNQSGPNSRAGLRSSLHVSDAFVRVRNTIKYLSALRNTDPKKGLELARSMGLDTLHEFADSTTPSYLPLNIDSLPTPQPSSWLTPGMTWHGLQSTDREHPRPAVLTRRQRRDALGRSMARNRLADTSSTLLPSDFVPTQSTFDTDRYISSLMQDSEGRWGFNNDSAHDGLPTSATFDPLAISHDDSSSDPVNGSPEVDHWPVTVTLHSVDFSDMTVSGTMRASQLPDKMVPSSGSSAQHQDEPQSVRSMESYFLGEIIDFRNHTLETSPSQHSGQTYKSGGVDVDARYWARLGPFRREIERQSCPSSMVNDKVWDIKTKADAKYLDSMAVGPVGMSSEERERMEQEADEAMARCLGDARWLEERLGRRGGEWILMRWKGGSLSSPARAASAWESIVQIVRQRERLTGSLEKCFVDPIINPSTTPTSLSIPSSGPHATSTSFTDRRTMTDSTSAQWGLTISGFYYVALNRVTGELDGLYFDPGSQPFQSLKMVPSNGSSQPPALFTGKEKTIGESSLLKGLGRRLYFPAVELR
jgi:Vacuolar import and degradation protein